MKFSKIIFISLLVCIISFPALGNDFIQEGSIGTVENKKPNEKKDFDFIPIEDWEGLEFIFLPKPKSLQEYGYQDFYKKNDKYYNANYDKYVGKTIEVINLKQDNLWYITFKVKETDETLIATAYSDSVDGIGFLSDIKKAREKWLNKTLWPRVSRLSVYNFDKDEHSYISIKKYSPLKVKNIVAGFSNYEPVKFILETSDGKQGYIDVKVSGTNSSYTLRNTSKFENKFFEINPRKMYSFTEKVWNAIEEEKVFVGMTAKQAELSWGSPKDINTTVSGTNVREQWVYQGNNYLYFENGKLASIQN